jgi:two-component system, OmpR family, sensor histidine kinase KdpD
MLSMLPIETTDTVAPASGFPMEYQRRMETLDFETKKLKGSNAVDSGVSREAHEPSLLSMVAHDLRAPLSAMRFSSELLLDGLEQLDSGEIRSLVSTIHRRSLWLQALVENLLCAGTIGAGRLKVRRRPTNLVDLVMEVQTVLEQLLTQREQQLRLSARGKARLVSADGRWLGQVLANLISNASKFGPLGTTIDVVLTWHEDVVRVNVADRGPGLPNGSKERLFEPFYRAGAAAVVDQEGTGLGLAIVRSIIDAHGGRVGAERRPGGGARFWFEIPITAAESSADADGASEEAWPGGQSAPLADDRPRASQMRGAIL